MLVMETEGAKIKPSGQTLNQPMRERLKIKTTQSTTVKKDGFCCFLALETKVTLWPLIADDIAISSAKKLLNFNSREFIKRIYLNGWHCI